MVKLNDPSHFEQPSQLHITTTQHVLTRTSSASYYAIFCFCYIIRFDSVSATKKGKNIFNPIAKASSGVLTYRTCRFIRKSKQPRYYLDELSVRFQYFLIFTVKRSPPDVFYPMFYECFSAC